MIVTRSGANVIAHAGSASARAIGTAFIPLGAIGLAVSAGLLSANSPSSSGYAPAIGGVLGLGSVALIVSGALMIRSARPGITYVGPMGPGLGVGATF